MNQAVIFQPFLATMILTLVVWVYMYGRRLSFIFSSGLDPKQMTPLELARLSPPQVSTPSDNLKNLFELPTVFYAVVLYIYVTHQVDAAACQPTTANRQLTTANSVQPRPLQQEFHQDRLEPGVDVRFHQVDAVFVGAAWGFFLFRALHSVVHCTFNFIPLRFVLYVISAGALWFMVLRAAMSALVTT